MENLYWSRKDRVPHRAPEENPYKMGFSFYLYSMEFNIFDLFTLLGTLTLLPTLENGINS